MVAASSRWRILAVRQIDLGNYSFIFQDSFHLLVDLLLQRALGLQGIGANRLVYHRLVEHVCLLGPERGLATNSCAADDFCSRQPVLIDAQRELYDIILLSILSLFGCPLQTFSLLL